MGSFSKRSMRNLRQFKGLSDEEFEEIYKKIISNDIIDADYENKIKEGIQKLGEDYDLDNLNANDMELLRNFVEATLQIRDLEHFAYHLRASGLDERTINLLNKVNSQINDLIQRINAIQDALAISRKTRQADEKQSLVDFIDSLKRKAKEFYEQKMYYVFCPECNTLLATAWFLDTSDERNRVVVYCNREIDGKKCEGKVVYRPAKDNNRDMTNNPDLMPEGV